jgi:hypothetical protein
MATNMLGVFRAEFRSLPGRIGGLRGALLVAALLLLGALPPLRFGAAFLDPLILGCYTLFALLFASSFSIRSFAGSENNSGASDAAWVYGKIYAAAAYGFLAFALILGAAFTALNMDRTHWLLPSLGTLAAVALTAAALALLAAAAGAAAALTSYTAASAQQLVRLGFFFVLLLLLGLSRFAAPSWRDSLGALLNEDQLLGNAFVLAVVLVAVASLFARRAVAILKDRRTNLSILGE